MTKLLHLVYAVWKTDRPFDPEHYPWDTAAADQTPAHEATPDGKQAPSAATSADPIQEQENAAGLKEHCSESKEVTAACSSLVESVSTAKQEVHQAAAEAEPWIDFKHLRSQVTMEQVLKHLGLFDQLRRSGGSRSQYRGTCPIHTADGKAKRHRTFSVNLHKQAFRCFHAECGAQGNVLDLWAAVRGLELRAAALDLIATFHLTPHAETEQIEKRNPFQKNPFPDQPAIAQPSGNRAEKNGGITPAPT